MNKMVFICSNEKCNEIWFSYRMWDEPLVNRCPHCGTIHYNHQAKTMEQIDDMIQWREEEKDVTAPFELITLKRMRDLEILLKTLDNMDIDS